MPLTIAPLIVAAGTETCTTPASAGPGAPGPARLAMSLAPTPSDINDTLRTAPIAMPATRVAHGDRLVPLMNRRANLLPLPGLSATVPGNCAAFMSPIYWPYVPASFRHHSECGVIMSALPHR